MNVLSCTLRRCVVIVVLMATGGPTSAAPIAVPFKINLLPEYKIQTGTGFDTWVGTISKPGGLSIDYDIGDLAGDYSSCKQCGWIEGEVWRRHQQLNGTLATVVFTKERRLIVSFPKYNANFYATVHNEGEVADMLLMLATYKNSLK